MKRLHAVVPVANHLLATTVILQRLASALRDWLSSDGLIALHLLKTAMAGLLALGLAMLLDLSQPRIAMTTVFVLMQPFSGMVLAKSFYRILGTAVGTVAALVLGAMFVQQPELYMLGIAVWVSACVAAAVRYRHFRWYGFVLAGYTAALIGIPNVAAPHELFLAALTRAAEVAVGILCSSAVSALIVPQRASLALKRALHIRYGNFTRFAIDVLDRSIESDQFERRFAELVDQIVGFEATRIFAAFEDPAMRSRGRHLTHLNSAFMDACTRLHALHQLLKRLRANGEGAMIDAIKPYLYELSSQLQSPELDDDPSRVAARLRSFRANLPARVRGTRCPLEAASVESLADFDTAAELLYRFIGEWVVYSNIYASLEHPVPTIGPPLAETGYVSRTNRLVVACTFLRSALMMSIVAWFWLETNWPSGGLAVIGAALVCALTSNAPNASRMATQMALGAVAATSVGYLFTCYVYPNIDGFPLLCATLAPVLALGAFVATRKGAAGYGIGFSVFFCLLAGPDNVVVYQPDLLINNGIALTATMLLGALVFAVAFPFDMRWLIDRIMMDLRAQVVSACKDALPDLNHRFQSSTHDLTSQLRLLLTRQSRRRKEAMRWMLATLEVGHAVIDLRRETDLAHYAHAYRRDWRGSLEQTYGAIAGLFRDPDERRLQQAIECLRKTSAIAQDLLDTVHADRERRHDLQRILSCLHFIRSALLDKEAPFHAAGTSSTLLLPTAEKSL